MNNELINFLEDLLITLESQGNFDLSKLRQELVNQRLSNSLEDEG